MQNSSLGAPKETNCESRSDIWTLELKLVIKLNRLIVKSQFTMNCVSQISREKIMPGNSSFSKILSTVLT